MNTNPVVFNFLNFDHEDNNFYEKVDYLVETDVW